MPLDSFYGGTGVEVLYPHDIMSHHFSEPDWSSSNPVCAVPNATRACKTSPSKGYMFMGLF